jgi:hypothetical protein
VAGRGRSGLYGPASTWWLAFDACGLTLDRDLNAAINLKHYVAPGGVGRLTHPHSLATVPGNAEHTQTNLATFA